MCGRYVRRSDKQELRSLSIAMKDVLTTIWDEALLRGVRPAFGEEHVKGRQGSQLD
jgi:hypothetical protein